MRVYIPVRISFRLGSLGSSRPNCHDPSLSASQFTISSYSSMYDRPKDIYHVTFPKDSPKSKVLSLWSPYAGDVHDDSTSIASRPVMIFGSCGPVFPWWVEYVCQLNLSTAPLVSRFLPKVAFLAEDFTAIILASSPILWFGLLVRRFLPGGIHPI